MTSIYQFIDQSSHLIINLFKYFQRIGDRVQNLKFHQQMRFNVNRYGICHDDSDILGFPKEN